MHWRKSAVIHHERVVHDLVEGRVEDRRGRHIRLGDHAVRHCQSAEVVSKVVHFFIIFEKLSSQSARQLHCGWN